MEHFKTIEKTIEETIKEREEKRMMNESLPLKSRSIGPPTYTTRHSLNLEVDGPLDRNMVWGRVGEHETISQYRDRLFLEKQRHNLKQAWLHNPNTGETIPLLSKTPTPDLSLEGIKQGATMIATYEVNKALEELNKSLRQGFGSLAETAKTINTMNTEKRIIGYKLKRDEFRNVAHELAGVTEFMSPTEGCDFDKGSLAEERLEKAGVLGLWFEPVYTQKGQMVETGKWYRNIHNRDIYQVKDIDWINMRATLYDLGNPNRIIMASDEVSLHSLFPDVFATELEVGNMLMVCAKDLGFEDGIRFQPIDGIEKIIFDAGNVRYLPEHNALIDGHGYVFFRDGEWATFIEKETLPEINGYDGEAYGEEYLKWGCFTIKRTVVEGMLHAGVVSLKLDLEDRTVKVSRADLEQVYEFLRKKI